MLLNFFNELSVNCCLSVAYYIEAMSYLELQYFACLSLCLCLGLFISYLCNILFIIIFIFITVNHIISLTQINLVFGHVNQNFSLRVLLSFCLFFCQFQPGVAYKSVAYKKSIYTLGSSVTLYLIWFVISFCLFTQNTFFFVTLNKHFVKIISPNFQP